MTIQKEDENSNSLSRKGFWIVFLIILAVGAFLRFHALGRAILWIDEIGVASFADGSKSVAQIVGAIYEARFKGFTGQHVPFQYMLMNTFYHFYNLFGLKVDPSADSYAFYVRLPFALLGFLTLPLIYGIASRVFNRKVGLWTLGVMTLSCFHVWQSRDSTSYAPLLFFLSLNLLGLVGLIQRKAVLSRWKYSSEVIFILGTAGALYTHLTSWLFMIAEGGMLGLVILLVLLRRADRLSKNAVSEARPLIRVVIMLALACLPFVNFLVWAAGGSGKGVDEKATPLTAELFQYQFAHFGWGRMDGRLTSFLIVLGIGLVAGLLSARWRKVILFDLGLILLPAFAFFIVLYRTYAVRYLAVTYIPLICLAGFGLYELTDRLSVKLPRMKWLPSAIIVGLLVLSVLRPYSLMFSMTNKGGTMSFVREWLMKNVPEGGLYVWRNGYFLNEIPGTYGVGDRSVAWGEYPNAWVPVDMQDWRSENTRSFFYRFPQAVLIAEPTNAYNHSKWLWMDKEFAHVEPLTDPTQAAEKLWRWGFLAGYEKPGEPFNVCYNLEEEILARDKLAGRVSIWPMGPGWKYAQTREGHLFAVIRGNAQLQIVQPADQARTAVLRVRGVGMDYGSLYVKVQGAHGDQNASASFSQSPSLELNLGPFDLPPGKSTAVISQFPSDRMALLVHSFEVVEQQPEKK